MTTPIKNKIAAINNFNGDNLEQFILTRNLDVIANWHNNNSDRFVYRTFRQMEGESHEIITKLKGLPDLSVFKKMKTSVLSLMQPKVRIYKVSYVEERPIREGSLEKKLVKLPVPCYREFKFSDNFGVEHAASPAEYLAQESTKPSFRNVGLKSFEMESLGGNYGPLQKEINAKLELTFKSLKDIQAQPPGEPHPDKGGLRYFDLFAFPGSIIAGTNGVEDYNLKHYQIKILIGWTSPSMEQLAQLNLTQAEMADVRKIENMNMMLSLLLQDYDINIKDDGSVSVSISYKSFIDSALSDHDSTIFTDNFEIHTDGSLRPVTKSETGDKANNMQKIRRFKILIVEAQKQLAAGTASDSIKEKIYDNIENDQFFYLCYVEAFHRRRASGVKKGQPAGSRIADRNKILKTLKKKSNSEKFHLVVKSKAANFRNQVYPSYMRELLMGFAGDTSADGSGPRLIKIHAEPAEIISALGIVYNDINDEPGTADINERDEAITSHARPKGSKKNASITIEKAGGDVVTKKAEEAEKAIKETQKEKDSSVVSHKTVLDNPDAGHDYYFVFLGDLIELAAKNSGMQQISYSGETKEKPWPYAPQGYLAENHDSIDYPLLNLRLLFGPLEYFNLRGEQKTINLTQFPIAFNLFRAWFLKNIVDRNEMRMPLHTFIRKLIEQLVMPSLGGAIPKSHRIQDSTVSFHGLTLPGKQSSSPTTEIMGRTGQPFEELLPKSPKVGINSAEFINQYYNKIVRFGNSETRVKTSFDYLLYQVSTMKHILKRTGNPAEDEKDGISHFSIGSDTGMLKKMTFEKVSYPYRIEELHAMASSGDNDQLEQLVFPYNTHVTLVGVPAYTPGMRYYINPSLLGLGSLRDANSVAHKLNLGGYSFAENVKMKIDSRGFVTEIKGFFEGHGLIGGRLIT